MKTSPTKWRKPDVSHRLHYLQNFPFKDCIKDCYM